MTQGTRARRVDELEIAFRETIETIHALYHVAAGEPDGLQHCASGLCRDALRVLDGVGNKFFMPDTS